MRNITSQSVDAFYNRSNFSKDDMKVVTDNNSTRMYLHNNLIAVKYNCGKVEVSNAGYKLM